MKRDTREGVCVRGTGFRNIKRIRKKRRKRLARADSKTGKREATLGSGQCRVLGRVCMACVVFMLCSVFVWLVLCSCCARFLYGFCCVRVVLGFCMACVVCSWCVRFSCSCIPLFPLGLPETRIFFKGRIFLKCRPGGVLEAKKDSWNHCCLFSCLTYVQERRKMGQTALEPTLNELKHVFSLPFFLPVKSSVI